MIREELLEIYKLLFKRFGPQHWWPGKTRFEIIIGAILTQNTNWGNVKKAISNLKTAKQMIPEALHKLKHEQLAELIRPAGYFHIKAHRVKSFLGWLFENYDGKLKNLEQIGTAQLREELLAVKGIGPETADSILLYAFERPIFVIDAYTARVMCRHHLIELGADYSQLQDLFQSNLPQDVKLFNEYHALLVRVGKDFCKPTAKCSDCPLEKFPHDPTISQL
jgi:endonuclease-3 related protein